MIDYLTETQARLWAIFRQTVPNWSTLVRPGNEISYITGQDYPAKRMMGNKQPGDYAEFSIRPLSFADQGFQAKTTQTFGGCSYLTDEATTFELRLAFPGLRYQQAGELLVAMKAALYRAGARLALVSPASPAAPALSYVRLWGGWAGAFKEEPDGGAVRLVTRTTLTVNYRFRNTDFGL